MPPEFGGPVKSNLKSNTSIDRRDAFLEAASVGGLFHFARYSNSPDTGAKDFQQRAEPLLLRNRGLGPAPVTVLPIALA